MAAKNIYGQESEQSKERRKRKADKLAGKGSMADTLKVRRIKHNQRLKEIQSQTK